MKKVLPVVGCVLLFQAAVVLLLFGQFGEGRAERRYGRVIHESVSDFSHIRVRERNDGVRSLLFVDEDGREQRQSAMDLDAPHELQLKYTRSLFSSLLFRFPQERMLIVGLGGGGMVRFVNHALPESRVEAVEIDPAVVEIADKYFGTRTGPDTTIHTRDAFLFLREPENGPYDVIYMDAFLKPTVNPDAAELTQQLKTSAFLADLKSRLKPGGVVAFNLIESDASTGRDLRSIRETFPTVYTFSVPASGNLVVMASTNPEILTRENLVERARSLEERLPATLPFQAFVDALR